MALDSDPRVSYWNNNYLKYWKNKTHSDAHSSSSDARAETDISLIFESLIAEHISGIVLDAGCGHGRLFPLLLPLSDYLYGVDISSEMINYCRSFYNHPKIKNLSESPLNP